MKNRDKKIKKIKKNAAHHDRYVLNESFVGEKKNGGRPMPSADPAGPIIPVKPKMIFIIQNVDTKMERKMDQNGTGSRVFHFGIYILYDKNHFGVPLVLWDQLEIR